MRYKELCDLQGQAAQRLLYVQQYWGTRRPRPASPVPPSGSCRSMQALLRLLLLVSVPHINLVGAGQHCV